MPLPVEGAIRAGPRWVPAVMRVTPVGGEGQVRDQRREVSGDATGGIGGRDLREQRGATQGQRP